MSERFYITDEQVKSLTEEIITILHGVPVGQVKTILLMADKTICDCLIVDATNDRFREWKSLDASSL